MTAAALSREASPGGRILVVDDHEVNCALLQEILEQEGHEVGLAASGSEALRRVVDQEPDLILLDVNMPGIDGFEVCRRLRADPGTASLPIILVTALTDREQRLRGIAAGADDYLTKPIDRTDLLLRVRNTLRMRRLHREVARRYEQLRQLEQLRDNLVHMLVHDLRTPLNGISGYLELAQQRVAELSENELGADLAEARRGVTRLTAMVSDVLDVSRFEADAMPLHPVALDLAAVAAEAIASLGATGDVSVVFPAPAEPIPVVADLDAIRRVIANLVGNAVKFTPEGGEVRVLVGPASPGAEVRIIDAGPGIPPEDHAKIFEKFAQLEGNGRRPIRSTGLGLAYCKLAVEAHRGSIGVESGSGSGSTFWFRLPESP